MICLCCLSSSRKQNRSIPIKIMRFHSKTQVLSRQASKCFKQALFCIENTDLFDFDVFCDVFVVVAPSPLREQTNCINSNQDVLDSHNEGSVIGDPHNKDSRIFVLWIHTIKIL